MIARCLSLLCIAVSAMSGCDAPLGPEQAELRNIKLSNRVPKSAPDQFIEAFEDFCITAPPDRQRREALLRNADYVPTKPRQTGKPQVFLVDDRRPAIVLSDTLCSVRALSRTGQTEKVRDFLRSRYPAARRLAPGPFGDRVEMAWQVSNPEGAIIATERGWTFIGHSGFSVTIFTPRG